MKLASLILGLTVASTSFAQGVTPNLFNCKSGDGSVEIHYSSSSTMGTPTLTVLVDNEVVFPKAAPGHESMLSIRSDVTVFGKMVYGMDSSKTALDAPNYIFAFFVPSFQAVPAKATKFDSVFLKGYTGGFKPQTVPDQSITSSVALECEAMRVFF